VREGSVEGKPEEDPDEGPGELDCPCVKGEFGRGAGDNKEVSGAFMADEVGLELLVCGGILGVGSGTSDIFRFGVLGTPVSKVSSTGNGIEESSRYTCTN
jgi:hypothetical protein